MKFRIGDKVKVVKCNISGEHCKNINKISTITRVEKDVHYPYMLKGVAEAFSEDELELVREKQFTKFDLKNGDKCTLGSGEVLFFNNDNWFHRSMYALNAPNSALSIVKVERPVKYETVFERKEEILDKAESKYLTNVITPFKDEVKYIVKYNNPLRTEKEYLRIKLINDEDVNFPDFKQGSMYKGMKRDKEYTLEELEL